MQSIARRLGIIGAVAVAAFLLQACGGNAGDLKVGDCFDEPAGAEDTVLDVENQPCTEPHDAEVVFVGDYAPESETFPGDEQFLAFFETTCTAAFNAYTGLDFVTDPTYDMSAYTPTVEGWNDDEDRTVICYAVRLDKEQITGSIRKL